jgi:hypothetical protein
MPIVNAAEYAAAAATATTTLGIPTAGGRVCLQFAVTRL